jgi:anti-sigma-K factor RskA
VERELEILAGLPTPAPRPEVLQRVQTAVRAEAARLHRRAALRRELPRWLGVAAAAVLAVGLNSVLMRSPAPAPLPSDGSELLDAWSDALSDALEDSSDRFHFLLADGWLAGDQMEQSGDALEGLFESFDTSLEQLGTLEAAG